MPGYLHTARGTSKCPDICWFRDSKCPVALPQIPRGKWVIYHPFMAMVVAKMLIILLLLSLLLLLSFIFIIIIYYYYCLLILYIYIYIYITNGLKGCSHFCPNPNVVCAAWHGCMSHSSAAFTRALTICDRAKDRFHHLKTSIHHSPVILPSGNLT